MKSELRGRTMGIKFRAENQGAHAFSSMFFMGHMWWKNFPTWHLNLETIVFKHVTFLAWGVYQICIYSV